MTTELRHRFPGLRSYGSQDNTLFFGRDKEVNRLLMLIMLEPIVVLHGKSGTGKSSLVKAALWEKAALSDWKKYFFRFGNYSETSPDLPTLIQATNEQIGADATVRIDTWLDRCAVQTGTPADSLWLTLKKQQIQRNTTKLEFILAFDQFEEVFAWPLEQIQKLKEELAEVISGKTPLIYRKGLQNNLFELSEDEAGQLMAPLSVCVLFILRSDCLNLLADFGDMMPNILRYFVEIKPLNRQQASLGLTGPASMEGDFFSPPFSFTQAALDSIMAGLENIHGEIEPFQLQIIGQAIESRMVGRPPGELVDQKDVEDVNEVLSNFYRDMLARLPTEDRQKAEILIEERLLIPDEYGSARRISLPEAHLIENDGLSKQLLYQLTEARLLRVEFRGSNLYYEIIHDALVKPALDAGRKRKLLLEEEEKYRQSIVLRKRQRSRLRIGILIVALLTILFIFFFLVFKN